MAKTADELITEIDKGIISKAEAIFVYETACLVCFEGTPISYLGGGPKICEKCRAAIMKVREQDGKE